MDKRTLLAAGAVIIALGAGFGLAKVIEPRADKVEATKDQHGEEGHAEEEGHADEKGHGAEESEEGLVKLTGEQAKAAGVAVVSVTHGGGADLRLTGRVEAAPSARAAISAPVAGVVERLLVAPGSSVAVGGALAIVRSGDGAAARADAVAAGAEAEAARAVMARESRLLEAGVVPRQDWEAARASSARASAQAQAARARAVAMGAPDASGRTVIRSPIAGVVTGVQAAPGGFLAQGGPVADVSDPGEVEVVFNAPAEAATRLKAGQALKIVGPDGSEADAVIVGVAPMAHDVTGAAIIRARPSGGRLTPGAAVSAAVAVEAGGYPTVPSEAVQTLEGRSVVFIAEPEGFRARSVTPGRSGGGFTQIVVGLKGDERVAGRGAFLLKAELAKGEAEHGH